MKVDIYKTTEKYDVIYADPPWSYRCWTKKGEGRSAESHYDTLPISEIAKFPVNKIASENCTLFMWVMFPQLDVFNEVITAWGFTYKTVAFVWVKLNKCAPVSSYQIMTIDEALKSSCFMGMGHWTRANAEICVFASKGKPKRQSASVSQLIFSPIGRHSAKPPEVREKIKELMGDSKAIELFAREAADGWDCWGNEAPEDKV